jgi:L-threonylcarbamoyladenylate synthase
LIKKQKNLININKIKKIDPQNPQSDVIQEAAEILKRGGVILVPTRCLYGLGADALNTAAVQKIFEIKKRPAVNPILVLIRDKNELPGIVRHIPPTASKIMDRFWPGSVTIVFQAKKTVPASLTAGTGKIGVRLPGHKVANALVSFFKGPVTGTSANLSGTSGCTRVEDLEPQITKVLDLILDAGRLKGGVGSTVIDLTGDKAQIIREGEVSAADIFSVLNRY